MTEKELNSNGESNFQNIDYVNKIKVDPKPSKITDIDVNGDFYDYLMDAADNSVLDLSKINSFTSISRSRDSVYTLLDMMAEDPTISSALKIYASDVCEPNDLGQVVWCDADDPKVLNAVTNILESLNIDKNSMDWVTSLIKYGDLYFRLYRESDFRVFDEYIKDFKKKQEDARRKRIDDSYVPEPETEKKPLNEDLRIYDYSKNDRYAEYVEAVRNPAQVFDLQKYGKSYGYIKTTTPATNTRNDVLQPRVENMWTYQYNQDDVELYEATEFVHACLLDTSSRTEEEISLTSGNGEDATEIKFDIKRGQSILYNSFKIWRELTLLENAVLLNRVTQSSIIRCVNVEVPDTDEVSAKNILRRVKYMFEQKSAVNLNTNFQDYTNAGPVQNTIYIPTHHGIGNITVDSVGGDVQVGDLNDLEYWKNKLTGSLGIPKQYLGDTSDSTGFNGGTSLSLISSRYAKTTKWIQNIYIQAITDIVNLILFDRGSSDYIGEFRLKMQAPTTQEEKDRRENISTQLSAIRNVMDLVNDVIQSPKTKLEIVKSLLADVINNENVIQLIQQEIDAVQSEPTGSEGGGGGGFGGDFGAGGADDLNLGGDLGDLADLGGEGGESEPLDLGGEGGETAEEPVGQEGFGTPKGKALNERNDLQNFAELGISYTDVR